MICYGMRVEMRELLALLLHAALSLKALEVYLQMPENITANELTFYTYYIAWDRPRWLSCPAAIFD